jgi:hypothetical protein
MKGTYTMSVDWTTEHQKDMNFLQHDLSSHGYSNPNPTTPFSRAR